MEVVSRLFTYFKANIQRYYENKNITKLLAPIALAIESFYISMYMFLRNLPVFPLKDDSIVNKLKQYTNFEGSYLNLDYYYEDGFFFRKMYSFNTGGLDSQVYLFSSFYGSIAEKGLKNFIFYRVFFPSCFEIFKNKDYCLSMENKLTVQINSISTNFDESEIVFDLNPFEIFLNISSYSPDVEKILKSLNFREKLILLFDSILPFYKLTGFILD